MNTYSLFNTSSDQAGFRLNYMEVYNWGTFDNQIFKISPQGNNSLLTGANASGKSTFIDALLTLLVPVKKDRFYNQSSGIDKKGDRTEETYVLGHYGNIQHEGEIGTSTQKLRDKNCYSVILANFSNIDYRTITLFQVRWFINGELKRTFGLAHTNLTISEDFNNFDAKGTWKKRLEKQYFDRNKRMVEFFDGPTTYAERFADLFGMRSTTALSLFNQVVGVKVLEDLDEFIRNNMLETRDAESEYLQLKESFMMLMEAKTNIEKAKEQINQLTPINELAKEIQQTEEQLVKLTQFKVQGNHWFAQKYIELAEQELNTQQAELTIKNLDLVKLKRQETALIEQKTNLMVQIKSDQVGIQIQSLTQRISQLEYNKQQCVDRLKVYNQLALSLELLINPNVDQFQQNRTRAQQSTDNTEHTLQNQQQKLRSLENHKDEIKKNIDELIWSIQILQKNQNNITSREAGIRDEILQYTGASKTEIPFIAELIKVNTDELAWEPTIEKIIHNFALRLIVPEKYYRQVNEYVNRTNLKGRIVYQRYQNFSQLNSLKALKSIPANALYHKLEFNRKSQYIDWLEDMIQNQFDYSCVDSLEEFNRYNEKAVTQHGLIKSNKGKHEKDDRPHIMQKNYFILGWNNQEKLSALKLQFNKLQESQTSNESEIMQINEKIKQLKHYQTNCNKLIDRYEQYDDIDWQSDTKQIENLKKQLDELKKANNRITALTLQLKEVETELSQLNENGIKFKERQIYDIENKITDITSQYKQMHQSFKSAVNLNTQPFVSEYSSFCYVNFENIDKKKIELLIDFDNKEKIFNQKFKEQTILISRKITQFKNPNEMITTKFIDWRSDVHHLPDPEHLDLIGEYQDFLQKLQNDNLPKFEKKFKDYLHETITNKVSDFRMFFMNWYDSIKENIQTLNEALQEINFRDKDFKTYIQIVCPIRINDEIKDFRRLLEKAIPNAREIEKNPEAQHLHFSNHIEPFIKKLEHEEWRKRVMQVRFWFNYKAEEFYREDNRKFKTYENMGQLSGGEKAQLTYTILGSAIAYQFGLTKEGLQSDSFRFIAIDEAFKAQDEDKARYLINLCKQLHLQLLVVTPSDNIHIVENDISFVHFVERKNERHSWLYDMPIEQFQNEKEQWTGNAPSHLAKHQHA